MQGYRVHEWGSDPVWEHIADPTRSPGELLVEVEACSVGRTVLNCINGDLRDDRAELPVVPGHELVGRAAAVGNAEAQDRISERVAGYFYLVCGECPACRTGHG